MRSSIIAATAVVLAGLNMVNGQTFTDCDPTKKTCAANPGLGTTITTDFTKQSADWKEADGTKLKYGPNGAEFTIDAKTDAPTIGTNKYIMFGKVSVTMKASPGTGTVSSFILESDDLDEIDWEWLGSTDTSVESNFFGKGNTTTYDRAIYHDVADPINTYITYTIDWTKDAVKWYIGDKLVRTLAYNDPKTLGGYNYPQTPMRVKMGSWIGCLDAAAAADPKSKGTCDWAGGYIDLTKGPFTMYVKSTTIQDYGCGGDYTYSDMTGTYQSIKSSGTCDGKADDTPASSSSAKPSTSASASASSSATSKTGGVLIETASGVSTVSSSTSASAASTTSAKASSTLATTTAVAPTTSASSTSAVAPSATTSSALAQQTTSGSSSVKSQHKYGVLDITVVALGLGLGYLVM